MTREQCLLRLSSAQFGMWEMRVYLDTHPGNKEAAALYEKYQAQYEKLKAEYEESFGALTLGDTNSDEWLKNPWPWDNN